MELESTRAKESELAREIPVCEQFQDFQNAAQANSRNHVRDGTAVAGNRHECPSLCSANCSSGSALEALYAVGILHMEKLRFDWAFGKRNACSPDATA